MRAALAECWRIARPYWQSEERLRARLLLGVIVALNLGEVYLNVLFNQWNNTFYNSLQAMDVQAFWHALFRFSYLAAMFIVVAVYRTYLNQMLRIRWRRWMTAHYLSDWLGKRNYYRMQLFGAATDNPDQRISEDIEQFIALTLGLSLGLLSAVVTLFSFLTILWGLSGALEFTFGGAAVFIPGYMVWVAIVYAIIGTWLTFRIGRPLVGLNFNQQRFEADFRFSLVRLRENSESVAFYGGEAREREHFLGRFTHVVDNFWAIMRRQKKLSWFTNGYQQIAIIFPFVVASPRYFAKQIQLGGLMQTASAFGQVQGALSYIIDAYVNVAAWKAVNDRLSGFHHSLAQAGALRAGHCEREWAEAPVIRAENLTLRLPDGSTLRAGVNLEVGPGDSLLITGPSGVGKSTLLRALAGLWPFVEGRLTWPAHAATLFLPQKPYLPLGTLKGAVCYPAAEDVTDAAVREVLALCDLSHLSNRLGEAELWSHVLSLGEQQRVAFARVLLLKPDFVFMDEATSALDENSEAELYSLLKKQLPNTAVVSVGHRASLKQWHKTELAL